MAELFSCHRSSFWFLIAQPQKGFTHVDERTYISCNAAFEGHRKGLASIISFVVR
jgi:hypothetical protein